MGDSVTSNTWAKSLGASMGKTMASTEAVWREVWKDILKDPVNDFYTGMDVARSPDPMRDVDPAVTAALAWQMEEMGDG